MYLKRLLGLVAAKPGRSATTLPEVMAKCWRAAQRLTSLKSFLKLRLRLQSHFDNIKKEKGKYYYLLEDGSHKKNFAITVNGPLFFDENGAPSSASTYSFTQETTNLVTDFLQNNAAYDSTKQVFELAWWLFDSRGSWYRPKESLKLVQILKASLVFSSNFLWCLVADKDTRK